MLMNRHFYYHIKWYMYLKKSCPLKLPIFVEYRELKHKDNNAFMSL